MNQLVESSNIQVKRGFKPGHNLSIGNKGRGSPSPLTQTLISLLNQIDKTKSKARMYYLCEKLWKLAMGYTYKKGDKTIEVQPDLQAILAIFDRVEGKPRQSMDITGQIEVEDVTAARAKLDKIIELKRVEKSPTAVD